MEELDASVRRTICISKGCLVGSGSEMGENLRPGIEASPVAKDMNQGSRYS